MKHTNFTLTILAAIFAGCRGGDGESSADTGTGLTPVLVGNFSLQKIEYGQDELGGFDPDGGYINGRPAFIMSCQEGVGGIGFELFPRQNVEPLYPITKVTGSEKLSYSDDQTNKDFDSKTSKVIRMDCNGTENDGVQYVTIQGKPSPEATPVDLAIGSIHPFAIKSPTFKFFSFGSTSLCDKVDDVRTIFNQAVVTPYQTCEHSNITNPFHYEIDQYNSYYGEDEIPGVYNPPGIIKIGLYEKSQITVPAFYQSDKARGGTFVLSVPRGNGAYPDAVAIWKCLPKVESARFYANSTSYSVKASVVDANMYAYSNYNDLPAALRGSDNDVIQTTGTMIITSNLGTCPLEMTGNSPTGASTGSTITGVAHVLYPHGTKKDIRFIAAHEIFHSVSDQSDDHYAPTSPSSSVNLMVAALATNPDRKTNLRYSQWVRFRTGIVTFGYSL